MILAVDDVPQNIRLLQAVLEPRGFTVVAAASGAEALDGARGGRDRSRPARHRDAGDGRLRGLPPDSLRPRDGVPARGDDHRVRRAGEAPRGRGRRRRLHRQAVRRGRAASPACARCCASSATTTGCGGSSRPRSPTSSPPTRPCSRATAARSPCVSCGLSGFAAFAEQRRAGGRDGGARRPTTPRSARRSTPPAARWRGSPPTSVLVMFNDPLPCEDPAGLRRAAGRRGPRPRVGAGRGLDPPRVLAAAGLRRGPGPRDDRPHRLLDAVGVRARRPGPAAGRAPARRGLAGPDPDLPARGRRGRGSGDHVVRPATAPGTCSASSDRA